MGLILFRSNFINQIQKTRTTPNKEEISLLLKENKKEYIEIWTLLFINLVI